MTEILTHKSAELSEEDLAARLAAYGVSRTTNQSRDYLRAVNKSVDNIGGQLTKRGKSLLKFYGIVSGGGNAVDLNRSMEGRGAALNYAAKNILI